MAHFKKGESKEQMARGGDGKVVLIGVAQEKTPVWRSWPAKGQENTPHPHMDWGRQRPDAATT